MLGGDRFLETAPANADKRQAVEWILDRYDGSHPSMAYFGDDDKDEEAFREILRRGGFPVLVGSRQVETRALIRLSSPREVREWLEELVMTAGNGRHPERMGKSSVDEHKPV